MARGSQEIDYFVITYAHWPVPELLSSAWDAPLLLCSKVAGCTMAKKRRMQ